jgi:hypothetical protein
VAVSQPEHGSAFLGQFGLARFSHTTFSQSNDFAQ